MSAGRTAVPDGTVTPGGTTAPAARPAGPVGHLALVRAVLFAAGATLTILGIRNGGLWDVFVKAANICTECIGLG